MELVVGNLVARFTAETAEFQRAMRDASRVGADTQKAMQDSAQAVTALENRLDTLRNQWRLNVIGEKEFAEGVKQVRADVSEMANSATLSANGIDRLAKVGQSANRELRNVTATAKRTADGFEAIGIATLAATEVMTKGIGGVAGASSALTPFTLGNPWVIGILGGLTALAAAWKLIGDNSKEAAIAAQDFSRLRLTQRGMTGLERRDVVESEIRNRERMLAETSTVTPSLRAQSQGETAYQINVVRGAKREAMEEEVANLRTILILNDNRLRQEPKITHEINMQTSDIMQMARGYMAATHEAQKLRAEIQDILADAMHARARSTPAALAGLDKQMGLMLPGGKDGKLPLGNNPGGLAFDIKDSFDPALTKARDYGKSFLDVGNVIGQGLIGMAASIGQGFKGMGKVMLGLLGNVMVEVGKSMILFGTAMKALKNAIKNPALAIAAGIGLVVLGTALGAAAQHSVNASGEGGGGGGPSGSFSSGAGTGAASDQTAGTFVLRIPRGGFGMDPNNPDDMDRLMAMLREARRSRRTEIEVYDA
jgi:hypothetical protein